MLDKHTTRDGERMLVCQMDDKHLLNTIKLFSKNLKQIWEIAEGEVENTVADKIYDVPEDITPNEAINLWRQEVYRLTPYLSEAILRDGIRDDVAALMQDRIGRDAPIAKKPRLKQALLVESTFDEDDLPF